MAIVAAAVGVEPLELRLVFWFWRRRWPGAPRGLGSRLQLAVFRFELFALVPNTISKPLQHLRFHSALHTGQIFFVDPVARMRQAQAEFTIISQKDQSFAVKIEPAHGMQVAPFFRQQVINRAAPQLIFARTNQAARLIQCDVNLSLGPDGRAIQRHVISAGLNFRSQLANGFPIYRDASGPDNLFAGPP